MTAYDQLQINARPLICTICRRVYFVAARQIVEPYVCPDSDCQAIAAKMAT